LKEINQKNVLIVVTDQQRVDHNGFMGNEVLQTPHLDALSRRSMVFENAWVSNPVCMPNRSTIMTGRMPSAHGVVFNDRSLDWNTNTFVRRFRKSGYRTGLIGKSHLQHGVSKNAMIPFRGEASTARVFPEGWDQVEDFERYLDGSFHDPEDYYGFDSIQLSMDHGANVAGHHYAWAREKGARHEDLTVDQDVLDTGTNRSNHWRQIYRPPYGEEFHSTSFVTERTIDFIESAEKQQQPWLAFCSFPDPHHPMTPPGKWFDMYNPKDMVLSESRHDPLTNAPAHLKLFAATHPKDQRNWVAPCGFGSDELLAQAMAATYGTLSMIDDGVGKIMSRLEALGILDDTIVVFTSDHGDMMGDHSLFLKGFMHYRGTLQVPFTMSVPGIETGRTQSLASSIDIAPTLLELCGIKGYDGIQGVSLVPVINDSTESVRDTVLIEDDVPMITAKLTQIPARIRTLITSEFQYTRNSKGEEQLFDLKNDPQQMDNVAASNLNKNRMVTALADAMMLADDSSHGAPSTENA
jgi:arylsulfatase A-like enzyme